MAELNELRDTGRRYELDTQGLTSHADYRIVGDRLYIDYVFTPVPLRGGGVSGRLMEAVCRDARAKGLRIRPICSYAAAWLERSDEFRDLVA